MFLFFLKYSYADVDKYSQTPPFITTASKTIITYQLNLYIRTDGLKFTRY